MTATVKDIIRCLEAIAPPILAEDWDNSGLQVGSNRWPVNRVWVALDPLPEVVEAACRSDIDLLVTHHPLIFRPLSSLDVDSPQGSAIQLALKNRLAVYAAHTNLDSAEDGLNDVIAERLGLRGVTPLQSADPGRLFKLIVFSPKSHEDAVLKSIFDSAAGRIGKYSCCTFRGAGRGTFLPDSEANPSVGETGQLSEVEELRIETIVQKQDLSAVIEQVRACHPYEEMAFDVYPLAITNDRAGLGRIGTLQEEETLADYAVRVRETFDLSDVRVAGSPQLKVNTVAVCSGSGSSLLSAFLRSRADVFVSGDLRYHDARNAEAAGKGIIDIGHFASEHIVVPVVVDRLHQLLASTFPDVTVEDCRLEKDPFWQTQ